MHMVHSMPLGSVDLNLLLVLRALLSERHVTRAAARVGLSQSATSHALSRLRELYGDPLLVRTGRALELTPRATRLLPALERGMLDLQSALDPEPEFEPSRAKLTFNIGMADYMQAVVMAPLLRRLASAAPLIDLSVVTFPNLSELVDSGRIDLALDVADAAWRSQSSESAFDDEFVCMVRRDHPTVKKKLSLAQYVALAHVVVAPTGGPGSIVDTELEQRGLQRRIALRVSNFLIAPVVVCETDFISTMPRRLARQVAARYPLRLLPPPLPLPKFGFSLSWHRRLDQDPAHRWLRASCASVFKEL